MMKKFISIFVILCLCHVAFGQVATTKAYRIAHFNDLHSPKKQLTWYNCNIKIKIFFNAKSEHYVENITINSQPIQFYEVIDSGLYDDGGDYFKQHLTCLGRDEKQHRVILWIRKDMSNDAILSVIHQDNSGAIYRIIFLE